MSGTSTLEQIIAALVQAEESGKTVDKQQLLGRYPEYAGELEEFLQLHAQFSAASGVSNSTTAASLELEATAPMLLQGPTSHTSLSSNPPKFFGDYEILEEIDRGGMGVVYKARHVRLGRIVALKLIRSGELASDEEIERFRSEAEAAATLTHPGIVPIHEVGMLHGLVFYTMAYIEGKSLAEIAAAGPLEPIEAARIVYKLCLAVEHAHRAGVFHRDLKPANVLIANDGQPIIIDFGLAKVVHRDKQLTATGQLLGTPAYMPPEHASGNARQITAAFDVYSLGAILYYLCAGQPPFSGPTPFDVLLQVLDCDPPSPSKLNRKIGRDLDYICLHALEKDPADRYQQASELASDLQSILRAEPINYPQRALADWLENWWRRDPILVAHVCGIGTTTAIVAVYHQWSGHESEQFPIRMFLLIGWLLACFALQYWVYRARWRDVACLTWATVDVTVYTTLIAFADPPRSMLLIGYPMMIVASSLFYRQRFVIFMTLVCAAAFFLLGLLVPMDDFVRPDFAAIFLTGLAVIALSLLAMIRRIRGLIWFNE